MFFSYTCILKYMNYIQSYTIIYLYIIIYTSIIVLIQGPRIPDDLRLLIFHLSLYEAFIYAQSALPFHLLFNFQPLIIILLFLPSRSTWSNPELPVCLLVEVLAPRRREHSYYLQIRGMAAMSWHWPLTKHKIKANQMCLIASLTPTPACYKTALSWCSLGCRSRRDGRIHHKDFFVKWGQCVSSC